MKLCCECIYAGLRRMLERGPCNYYGDIPCLRCKRYVKKNDEFCKKSDEHRIDLPYDMSEKGNTYKYLKTWGRV